MKMNKTVGAMLIAFSVVAGNGAWAMGGGGMGGGMGPGWGIDYGQSAPGSEANHAKPAHRTKSVKHDHKHVVAH